MKSLLVNKFLLFLTFIMAFIAPISHIMVSVGILIFIDLFLGIWACI